MEEKAWPAANCLCERIPEKEFDFNPRLNDGWEVLGRKNGYVYVGYTRKSPKPPKRG